MSTQDGHPDDGQRPLRMPSDAGERYERLDLIATGGMGAVWRGRDTVLGRGVAIKVLKPEYAESADFRARFEAEARHAASLHHPGIASVFDCGRLDDGTPILVMELVDGQPLSRLLRPGQQVDPSEAVGLGRQAADALAAAHARGVVHRDIKPGNLLVTPQGELKITDFGIARAQGAAGITQTGEVLGTPHYLSPEQAAGEETSPASDVYSLGVVLYECLAGRKPFDADTPVAIALAHLRKEPDPLPDSIPPGLTALVMRAMSKNPADRYADGGELATALRDLPEDPPGDSTTRVLAAPVAAAAAAAAGASRIRRTTTTRTPPADEPRRAARKRLPGWWPIALLALLLIGLLIALAVAQSGDPKPPPSQPAPTHHPRSRPSSTPTHSSSPETVQVNPSDYIGRQADDASNDLRDLGLHPYTTTISNDGSHDEGTVASLSPSGRVERGASVALRVYDKPSPSPSPHTSAPAHGPGPGHGHGEGHGGKKGGGHGG